MPEAQPAICVALVHKPGLNDETTSFEQAVGGACLPLEEDVRRAFISSCDEERDLSLTVQTRWVSNDVGEDVA